MGISKTFNIVALGSFSPSAGEGGGVVPGSSDVVDIVDTYADLTNYDTSKLKDNDIIKVLSDSTHSDLSSYYRWNKSSSNFTFIGTESSLTFLPFNSSWITNSTTETFLSNVFNDANAKPRMAYMGAITCSDLPFNGNAEAVVTILPSTVSTKVVHATITSGTNSPYRWECSYYVQNSTPHYTGWIGFQPELPNQTNNSGKVLSTDGTDISWQYAAQFVSGTTQNDIEIGNSSSSEIDWGNLQFGDRLDNKATYIGTFHAQDPNQTAQDYAVFVLDAQYRDIKYIGDLTASLAGLPEYTTSNVISDAHESATYNTNTVINNINSNLIPAFTFAHSMSVVVNGTTFYGQIPNCYELDVIWKNKTEIDNADPTVSSYSTMSISNFGGGNFACGSNFADNYDLGYFKGANYGAGAPWNLSRGDLFTIPVFEIPIPLPATRYTNVNRLKVNGVIYQIQDKSQFNVVGDSTTPSLALVDNTYYTFTNALTSLTISSIPAINISSIDILFTADTGFSGVTFPANTLYTGTIPTWEAGKTYLISIQKGIVVAAEIKTME